MDKNQEGKERRSEEEARANKRKYVKRGGQRSKRNKGEDDTQDGGSKVELLMEVLSGDMEM